VSGSNRFAKVRRCGCARARGPRPSPTAAGVVAEPPCATEKELTGGASPSASRRERREGGSDERDPPVSDPQREEGGGGATRAARAWAEQEWAGLRADFPATRCTVFFFLFFCAVFALCLILCNKLCADPKNYENFCIGSIE